MRQGGQEPRRPPTGRLLRRTVAGASLLLVIGALPACGHDAPDYCGTLRTEQKTLTTLATQAAHGDGDVLTPTLAAFERLRAVAPSQLSDEWDTVVFAYRALADAVKEAGIDPAQYHPGKRPPGVSPRQAKHLAAVAAQLDAPRVIDAVSGIEDHARQVCNVDFRG